MKTNRTNEIIDIGTAVGLIMDSDRILVQMHRNPDGDTIGCAYALWSALRHLGKTVMVGCCDKIPAMYSYLTELYDLQSQTFSPSVVISVDAGSLSQLGDFMNPCEGILLSIDHHDSNTMYASYNLVDSSYASCCEIVYELIDTLSVKLDEYIASAIYTGVSTDTGCFKYRNTTANAHYVTARLIETDIDLGMLNRVLFESKTKEFLQLQQLAIASLKFYLDDKIAVTTVTRDMFELSGAVEEDMTNISPLARAIDGVEVGLTFRETSKGSIKCSVRSSDKVDASAICRLFGGGGHKGAAAFECTGDMTEIQTKTIDTVISFLKNSE